MPQIFRAVTSKHFLPPAFWFLFLALPTPGLRAGEVEIDLTAPPRIYQAEGGQCAAVPVEGGSGVRMNYDFENSSADWAHFVFPVPAIDQRIEKITLVAKGSAGVAAIAVRAAQTGRVVSWNFGPLSEDGAQTVEIDTQAPGKSLTEQEYPIKGVFFQIKAREGRQGFLEIERAVIHTAD